MADDPTTDEMREREYQRRSAIPTWATFVDPCCTCEWEPDDTMWKLTGRNRECDLHGVDRWF